MEGQRRRALVTRQANVGWLVKSFGERGLTVERRVAGQSPSLHDGLRRPAQELIHGFNSFWFRHVKSPGLAYGNILFLRKKKWRANGSRRGRPRE